jgi:hypothetical protein
MKVQSQVTNIGIAKRRRCSRPLQHRDVGFWPIGNMSDVQ